jgi:hypothetical protein
MRYPQIGQLVWSNGRTGRFEVVRVDVAHKVADIQGRVGRRLVYKNIPFSAIHPLHNVDVSQAAVRTIREAPSK